MGGRLHKCIFVHCHSLNDVGELTPNEGRVWRKSYASIAAIAGIRERQVSGSPAHCLSGAVRLLRVGRDRNRSGFDRGRLKKAKNGDSRL